MYASHNSAVASGIESRSQPPKPRGKQMGAPNDSNKGFRDFRPARASVRPPPPTSPPSHLSPSSPSQALGPPSPPRTRAWTEVSHVVPKASGAGRGVPFPVSCSATPRLPSLGTARPEWWRWALGLGSREGEVGAPGEAKPGPGTPLGRAGSFLSRAASGAGAEVPATQVP